MLTKRRFRQSALVLAFTLVGIFGSSQGRLSAEDRDESEDQRRLVISDYFLNEDDFGKVHAEGDHRIHVAKVTKHDLVLDPRFDLDFNAAFSTGPARPHGIAIK